MPKVYKPKTIHARDASATIYTIDPTKPQLNFWEGEENVYYVVTPVAKLEKLERDIQDVLQKLRMNK
jgi:hypothetical protein